jgi:hypothetical protein
MAPVARQERVSISRRVQRAFTNAENPRSFSARARSQRFGELVHRFPDLAQMRVLDLGGVPGFWRRAPVRPASVTTLNLAPATAEEPWLRHIVADACDLQPALGDERFDLVVSNSLIEHVGGHHRRQQLARVIGERADAHWVQTPNRYFPLEPHWMAPGFQFLPLELRAAAVRRWPFKHRATPDRESALRAVLNIELLTRAELAYLFPESEIWRERVGGYTKSLVAVRTP